MKKLLLILLTVALAVTLAFALTSCGGPKITYELSEDGTYYIVDQVRFEAPDAEVVIPEEYEGLPVKEIGYDAFIAEMNDSFITKLIIPASVTKMNENGIGELCRYQQGTDTSAFVTDIYYGGTEQQWFTMMDGGNCRFYNLYINETLVTSPTIPADMNVIPEEYANGCMSLTEVILPSTVTAVGRAAFSDCYNLATITIPETVGSIEGYAFSGCYNLTTLNYSAVNATIGKTTDTSRDDNGGVFQSMGTKGAGTVVYINKSVEVIPDYFLYANSWSDTGVNVKKFVIADECNFKKIGVFPFANTISENSEFTTEGGLIYIGSAANPYMFCGGAADINISAAEINEKCLYILDSSFKNCDKLETITIPKSVIYIGCQAFYTVDNITFESTSGWKIIGTNKAANLDYIDFGYTKDEYSKGITKMN